MNKNKDKYNEEQMQYIMDNMEEYLNFFGYTTAPEGNEPNPYSFFDYKEKAKAEYVEQYYGFEKLNQEMEDYWINQRKGDMNKVDFKINSPGEGIRLIVEKDIMQYVPLPTLCTIREGKGTD